MYRRESNISHNCFKRKGANPIAAIFKQYLQWRIVVLMLSGITAAGCYSAGEKTVIKASSGTWATGKSPIETGKRVARDILSRPMGHIYTHTCAWYGVLLFSEASENVRLCRQVENAYTPYLTGDKIPHTGHVDNNVFGIVPFELFRQTRDRKYLPIAKLLADEEWTNPREDGLTRYTRFTADDPYMVGTLQAQAYRNTGDTKYADRGSMFILRYLEKLQRADGLIIYRERFPFTWGRGNGWTLVGITETLLCLPENHPNRPGLMKAYTRQVEALVRYQHSGGMWHQIIDMPEYYLESSGTGMFIYAIATGIVQGWLPANPYREIVERAWRALTDYVDNEGKTFHVSTGNIRGIHQSITYLEVHGKHSEDLYPSKHPIGDYHGQAAVLWAAAAMIRLDRYNFED